MTKNEHTALLEVCNAVSKCFIKQLSTGKIPWHVTWNEIPKDIMGRPFHSTNIWLLGSLGLSRNIFLTPAQIRDMKATIKPGEEPYEAVFWKKIEEDYTPWMDKLFNIYQLQGIRQERIPPLEKIDNPLERCKDILMQMPKPPIIVDNGSTVYYSLIKDIIHMPQPEFFENDEQWYSSVFYLLVLSTGRRQRLNRPNCTNRALLDPKTYSVEDLIAEMGCSFLCSFAGIEPWYLTRYHNDSTGWLQAFSRDPTLALTGSIYAQEAVNYILNLPNVQSLLNSKLQIQNQL